MHTPGPWELRDNGVEFEIYPPGVQWMHSHSTDAKAKEQMKRQEPFTTELANARLMAAAPEMLALLKESQESIGGDWRTRRDAAIAKAEGATPCPS